METLQKYINNQRLILGDVEISTKIGDFKKICERIVNNVNLSVLKLWVQGSNPAEIILHWYTAGWYICYPVIISNIGNMISHGEET